MKELFLPYELALLAKKKEFIDVCFGYFENKIFHPHFEISGEEHSNKLFIEEKCKHLVAAPLYQQIIDWFREKHSIDIDLWTLRKTWSFTLSDISEKGWTKKDKENKNVDRLYPRALSDDCKDFDLYYEALNKAIEEAFKLI